MKLSVLLNELVAKEKAEHNAGRGIPGAGGGVPIRSLEDILDQAIEEQQEEVVGPQLVFLVLDSSAVPFTAQGLKARAAKAQAGLEGEGNTVPVVVDVLVLDRLERERMEKEGPVEEEVPEEAEKESEIEVEEDADQELGTEWGDASEPAPPEPALPSELAPEPNPFEAALAPDAESEGSIEGVAGNPESATLPG